MKFLFSLALAFFMAGILIFFKINPTTIRETIDNTSRKEKSLKSLSIERKSSKFFDFLKEITFALSTMGQLNSFYFILLASVFLILAGFIAGISLGSMWLSIAFSIMLASIPFLFVRYQYIEYKSLILDQLETGLSVITSSISRTSNIQQAVAENIGELQQPLLAVFQSFLFSLNHNVPIEKAIDEMKTKISNPVFIDWCDRLKEVTNDRSIKHSLRPIIDRITNIKIAENESKNILREARSEFISVSVLSVIFIGLSYFLIPFFLDIMGYSTPSAIKNALFAIDLLMLFFMAVRVFKLTKDIDFDKC